MTAGQTQLADGLSLADLNTQTLNLTAMPTAFLGLAGGPTTSQSQFPTLAAVQADTSQTTGGSVIILDALDSIALSGIPATSLAHADFRFV